MGSHFGEGRRQTNVTVEVNPTKKLEVSQEDRE